MIRVNTTGLHSLSPSTEIMLTSLMGKVTERDNYFVIHTPDQPNYYYGNFLIFKSHEIPEDISPAIGAFEKEFPDRNLIKHRLLIWDEVSENPRIPQSVIQQGFSVDPTLVLTMSEKPADIATNTAFELREVNLSQEINALTENHMANIGYGWTPKALRGNLAARFPKYMQMVKSGHGTWFGAYSKGKLIADFGLFHDGEVARFQAVNTHPNYQKQGACRTLLKHACETAFQKWGVKTLVMAADPTHHARRVYEAVGFKPTQWMHALLKKP